MAQVDNSVADDPVVAVVVKNALAAEGVDGSTQAEVSNIEAIKLEIGVSSSDKKIPDDFAEGDHFSLEARQLSADGKPKVAVEIREVRYAIRHGAPKAFLSIVFPLDPKVRQAKIEQFINKALESGVDSGRIGRHFVQGVLTNKQMFVKNIEETFVENRVGSYELDVFYRNKRSGYWQGVARAPPMLIVVLNKGSYFDTLDIGSGGER